MDWNWVRYMKTLDHPSFWLWLLIIKEVFFVLLIFKVWSGNWGGFKKKKQKEEKKLIDCCEKIRKRVR